ncbi:MAG: Sec-independent protein translocase protein TatA [Alphaproteobacteria bacterium MarineAlpha5_Bin9]|mgnify:CR=1 FL=1|nr:MAG: Sec-independent protein translocase protein TatA [Alphaproteobacteria bacterium MarineAlpha5_Bin9]|tara:strand:- start:10021 stop:10209 length:189 start_codon:yes stop_codon:yes gene_type:complete
MTPSIWQLLIVLAIVLLLFGRGKIPQLMGDMAKGIKSFKSGMKDENKKETDNIEENKSDENK